ncbi:MAG: hypothetical protein HC915_08120 [Anaerolineae bacterium]|nr:hypothetical protein [Anaerolineae bacterium]
MNAVRISATGWVWLVYGLLVGVICWRLLEEGHRQLIGPDYAGGLSFWVTWFPPQAIRQNLDLSFNAYTLYPIETNLLPVLSLPSSFFYHLLRRAWAGCWPIMPCYRSICC